MLFQIVDQLGQSCGLELGRIDQQRIGNLRRHQNRLEPGRVGPQRHLDVGEAGRGEPLPGVRHAGEVPHVGGAAEDVGDRRVDRRDVAPAAAFGDQAGAGPHPGRQRGEQRGMVLDPVAALRADRTAGLLAGIGAALTLGLTVGYRLAAHEAHTPTSRALVMAGCAAAAFVFAFTAVANGWMRYAVILALSRRTLPARLGRFLRHAEAAGLLRIEGMAYQFRHRELQEWLAAHQTPTVAGTSVVGG